MSIVEEALTLKPIERLHLVDELLLSLDVPTKEIDLLWAEEAEKRIQAYNQGNMKTLSSHEVFAKVQIMNIDFLELAALELDDAFAYYEYQQQNLGRRFIYEISNTIERIKYYPKAWHGFSNNTRRCLVKNFPYGVIYQEKEDNSILIVAIMNLHRKPNYWIERLK